MAAAMGQKRAGDEGMRLNCYPGRKGPARPRLVAVAGREVAGFESRIDRRTGRKGRTLSCETLAGEGNMELDGGAASQRVMSSVSEVPSLRYL